MKVFVGYGYNERDKWIEDQVFPILRYAGFVVVDGKDLHGQILQPAVEQRLNQSDAAIGFFTIREEQADAGFTSHIWVRDEMIYANSKGKAVIPIKEEGVKLPEGLLGNRQHIVLNQNDRLACVAELLRALGEQNMRRVRLDLSDNDDLRSNLWRWRNNPGFAIRYRTLNDNVESEFRNGRLEVIDQAFFVNLAGVPNKALIEIEGVLDGAVRFGSGWASADAVQVRILSI